MATRKKPAAEPDGKQAKKTTSKKAKAEKELEAPVTTEVETDTTTQTAPTTEPAEPIEAGADPAQDDPMQSGEVSALEMAAEAEMAAAEPDAAPAEDAKPAAKKTRKKTAKTAPDAAPGDRGAQNRQRRANELERATKTEKNQVFYSGISALQAAQKSKAILTGKVVAVESYAVPESKKSERRGNMVAFSVLLEDRYKVLIPFAEFYRDNPIDMDTVDRTSREGLAEYERRQTQMAQKLFGVDINFVVTNVFVDNASTYAISGSRRQALEILEKRNFGSKTPRIKVNDIVSADILSVGNHALFVTVGGVDTQIPLRDTTFEYVPNLNKKYAAGTSIAVEVLEAVVRPQDGRIVLGLSGKKPELLDAIERQKSGIVAPGTNTVGTITSVRRSTNNPGKITIRAYLDYFKMPAIVQGLSPSSLAFEPKAGDSLRLMVTKIYDNGFVQCSCRGFNNTSAVLVGRN